MRLVVVLCALVPTVAAAQATPAAPSPGEVYFRSPANGATVPATFPVVFGLRNYGVAPAGVNVPRTGHFHIIIDGNAPAVGVVIPTDSLHRHFGAGQIETQLSLSPGPHTLRLVLGDFEHKVIAPELVSPMIRVTVQPPAR